MNRRDFLRRIPAVAAAAAAAPALVNALPPNATSALVLPTVHELGAFGAGAFTPELLDFKIRHIYGAAIFDERSPVWVNIE